MLEYHGGTWNSSFANTHVLLALRLCRYSVTPSFNSHASDARSRVSTWILTEVIVQLILSGYDLVASWFYNPPFQVQFILTKCNVNSVVHFRTYVRYGLARVSMLEIKWFVLRLSLLWNSIVDNIDTSIIFNFFPRNCSRITFREEKISYTVKKYP